MRYFLLLCLSLSSYILRAQSSELKSFLVGGVNFNKPIIDGSELRSGTAFLFGAAFSKPFSKRLRLNLDLLYSERLMVLPTERNEMSSGFDVNIAPAIVFDDFSFSLGYQLRQADALDQNSILLGLDFKLSNRLRFFYNLNFYQDPIKGRNTQVGIKYAILNQTKTTSLASEKRQLAIDQINELKSGVLLVKLKRNSKAIAALRKVGQTAKAQRWEDNQAQFNQELVHAFHGRYQFSEVRFFYAEHTNKIKQGNLEGIVLDKDMKPIQDLSSFEGLPIFIAEYGTVDQDQYKRFSHYRDSITGSFSSVKVPVFYGGPNLNIHAIIISNQQNQQLSRPFPYYSRFITPEIERNPEIGIAILPLINLAVNESADNAVQLLDEKLQYFYFFNKTE